MENGFGHSYGGGGYGYSRNENTTPERSLVCVRATVMLFDNDMKRWIASGPFAGLSRIEIYHHTYHNSFRISGIRMDSGEVSLDCDVTQSLVYNHATPIFHQWKQDGRIVGLHFNSENEAKEFSRSIDSALETLNNPVNYSTSNYTDYGSGPVTTARPAFQVAEAEAIRPAAKSSPEVTETTTATRTTPNARTPADATPEGVCTTASSLAPTTSSELTPETTTATATNNASYTPASITPAPSSSSSPSAESTTAASAASAASDPVPNVTSPKFQTSCRFVPKAQTNAIANELSSSSSSSPFATTTTAPSPPTTTPSYFGTPSSIPHEKPSKQYSETKDYEKGSVNVVQSQPTTDVSVVENQSADDASNIPTVTPNDSSVVPQGPPPFVPPPPPPPPPPPVCITPCGGDLGSALLGAQLRKSPRGDDESGGGGGTLSRSASPSLSDLQSDIMSEMARKLKERKARANATPSPVPSSPANAPSSATSSQLEPVTLQERRASFDRILDNRRPSTDRSRSPIPFQPSSATSKPPAINSASDSPKFPRSKRIQSLTGQEGPPSVGGSGSGGQGSYATSAELESVKQELMTFVKTEVTKAKQEIIDAVRLLLISSRQQ